jgi:glutamate carboxypeptidase
MHSYAPYLDAIDEDHEELVSLLTHWAGTNSFSNNLPGLDRMASILEEHFRELGGDIHRVALGVRGGHALAEAGGKPALGPALRMIKRPDAAKRVLLCCHMDTVYPPDHPFQKCRRVDANVLEGPGVADAKGGILVLFKALQGFERSPWAANLGWEVLINPDEEIGSPGSSELLADAAGRNQIGLVFEPCFPNGDLVSDRKGSGNFSVVVRGRAAHAGREPHLGRSAITALARFVLRLSEPLGDGVLVNVGHMEGGGQVNVVAERATCRFNVRVMTLEDQYVFEEQLQGLVHELNRLDGISLTVEGRFTRPPKPLDDRNRVLLEHIADCGRDIGLRIAWRPTGGACDGNNLAAAGLVTVDSLGVQGGALHSPDEYVLVSSISERAKLSALLLMKIAAGDIPVHDLM